MIHLLKDWLMFDSIMQSEPPLWPLVLATIMASAMILGRQPRD